MASIDEQLIFKPEFLEKQNKSGLQDIAAKLQMSVEAQKEFKGLTKPKMIAAIVAMRVRNIAVTSPWGHAVLQVSAGDSDRVVNGLIFQEFFNKTEVFGSRDGIVLNDSCTFDLKPEHVAALTAKAEAEAKAKAEAAAEAPLEETKAEVETIDDDDYDDEGGKGDTHEPTFYGGDDEKEEVEPVEAPKEEAKSKRAYTRRSKKTRKKKHNIVYAKEYGQVQMETCEVKEERNPF